MLKVLIFFKALGPNTTFSVSHMANAETSKSSGKEKVSSEKEKKSHTIYCFDFVKEQGSLKFLLLL